MLSHFNMSDSVFCLLQTEASLLYNFCIKSYYCGTTESFWKFTFGEAQN